MAMQNQKQNMTSNGTEGQPLFCEVANIGCVNVLSMEDNSLSQLYLTPSGRHPRLQTLS
jgi:hypothetical protein